MTHLPKGIVHLLLFMLVCHLIACGNNQSASDKPSVNTGRPADRRTLEVALMPTLDCLPVFIAAERGWFDRDKADIGFKSFQAAMDIDTALTHGSSDGGVTDLIRAEALRRKGVSLSLWSALPTYWQLIVNEQARVKEPKQLSDKTVAMTRHSATDYFSDAVITEAKTPHEVYRVQINDIHVRLQMLLSKSVDAAFLPEPQATVARNDHHRVLFDSRNSGFSFGVWVWRSRSMNDTEKMRNIELFKKIYNEACDSINRYGFRHYADIIVKHCHIENTDVDKIPPVKYKHISAPRQEDTDKARHAF